MTKKNIFKYSFFWVKIKQKYIKQYNVLYITEPLTTGPDFDLLFLLIALSCDVHLDPGPPRYQLPVYKMFALGTFKMFWSSKRCDYRRANDLICSTCGMPRAPSPPPSPAHTSTMSDKAFNILEWNIHAGDTMK